MTRHQLLFIIFYGSLLTAAAQIAFDVNLSDKHSRKVERAKGARSKLSTYKAVYIKDSIRSAKEAWRQYKHAHKDSLKAIKRWKAAKVHKKELLLGTYQLDDRQPYTVDPTEFRPPIDSMDWALQELARRGDFDQLQRMYEAHAPFDSIRWAAYRPDSLHLTPEQLADRFQTKERLQQYLPAELQAASDTRMDQQLKQGFMDEYGQLQSIDRSGVEAFFQQIAPAALAQSQATLAKKKAQYATLPTLSQEAEGIKRQSLKGSPLKERLFINGNVALQSTDPLVADVNVQLGYRWNKRWSIGVGLLWREQFRANADSTASLSGDSHGIRGFSSYDVAKGFFLYGEYQVVRTRSLFSREQATPASWQQAGLVGAGRSFKITSKIHMSVLLLYDLNYRNNTLNQRPIVPRIGYEINL